jgi:hypothetical protein
MILWALPQLLLAGVSSIRERASPFEELHG